MERLLIGTGSLFMLPVNLFFASLWIGLWSIVPYKIGTGVNKLILNGRSFSNFSSFFYSFAVIGFLTFFVFLFGASVIQIFSISGSEWWYTHLFPFGALGNLIGGVSCGVIGLLTGKDQAA